MIRRSHRIQSTEFPNDAYLPMEVGCSVLSGAEEQRACPERRTMERTAPDANGVAESSRLQSTRQNEQQEPERTVMRTDRVWGPEGRVALLDDEEEPGKVTKMRSPRSWTLVGRVNGRDGMRPLATRPCGESDTSPTATARTSGRGRAMEAIARDAAFTWSAMVDERPPSGGWER